MINHYNSSLFLDILLVVWSCRFEISQSSRDLSFTLQSQLQFMSLLDPYQNSSHFGLSPYSSALFNLLPICYISPYESRRFTCFYAVPEQPRLLSALYLIWLCFFNLSTYSLSSQFYSFKALINSSLVFISNCACVNSQFSLLFSFLVYSKAVLLG